MTATPDDILQDILGGANGAEDTVEEATKFLADFSTWFVELINTIRNFFTEIMAMLGK